ncbi:MAG: beta-N-acetylhexosaminidase [Lachnospiraceae bacterium]|nr:beta-N-acetylhexosaminidase [Lachnospiraceae bacterium]
MKIRLANSEEWMERILKECEGILERCEESGKECEVTTVNTGKENCLSIEKACEGSLRVNYGSRTSFCRALLHIAGVKDAGEAVTEEKSSFTDFGIMLDCSRNGVPKVKAVKNLIGTAAFMGYTFIGLYTEETFEVDNEPYFGYMRGRYTQEEIRELVEYGEIFGVEIRPFVQTLAHLNQIVRYNDYGDIIDANDILLIDEDRTYKLIENIVSSAARCYKTRKINIGMDEAHMVGLGEYLKKHGFTDRHKLMEKHLSRVLEICGKYGFEAEMWSDMFFRIANGGDYRADSDMDLKGITVPKNVTLCYWDYYSTDQTMYSNMLKQHRKLTDRISFAGGAWKWQGFAPFNRFSIETGRLAINACRESDIKECTITCWGDDGDECSVFSVLPALFTDAAYAYAKEPVNKEFTVLTGIDIEKFIRADHVNPGVGFDLTRNTMSKNLLYNDPLIGTFDNLVREDTASVFAKTASELAEVKENKEYAYLFDMYEKLCRVLELKADLGVRIKKAYDGNDKADLKDIAENVIPELLKRLDLFYEANKLRWMKENKAFGYEVQAVRLGGVERRLKDVKQVFLAYVEGKVSEIEELKEKRLPFDCTDGKDLEHTVYNNWMLTVSPSRLDF